MNRRLAPEIFRKRLLIEGFFSRPDVGAQTILEYLRHITSQLGLRTYAEPIVHQTGGQGKDANQGFDAFVPLIDSGIYVCVWSRPRFLSIILFTCAEFDEQKAEATTAKFFAIGETDSFLF
jgi:S-adenosylmethionine decarboxylase